MRTKDPFMPPRAVAIAGEPLTFVPWVQAIVKHQPKLAYIHATEARTTSTVDTEVRVVKESETLAPFREVVHAAGIPFIVAGGYTPEEAIRHAAATDDLVAIGRHYISNPDLPARVKNGWPLQPYDRSTFYTQGAEGYTTYPAYKEKEKL